MTVENFIFQLVDELARKKADYTKHLETYRSMRSRFEEHFFKSKQYILLKCGKNKLFKINLAIRFINYLYNMTQIFKIVLLCTDFHFDRRLKLNVILIIII